jgi:hypothetical protein
MIPVNLLSSKIKEFLINQLDGIAKTNPMIGFIKPIIVKIIDNNFNKTKKFFNLIADSEGNIDIESILPEMIESVMKTEPFVFKTDFIGDIEIGGGLIKLNVPIVNKTLAFNNEDLEVLKELLITKE